MNIRDRQVQIFYDLDGILYLMRMEDLSKLEFNAEPGFLAQDIAGGMKVWPVLQDLVDAWPGHSL